MSTLPISTWNANLFVELQHLLSRVASQPTTSLVRRLFSKLDEAQPWILTLTALPGPNEEDKHFIAKSPITSSDGSEVRVTDELLATTNAISSTLELSHLFSAVLALQAIQQRSRYPSRSDAEIAVYLLHESLQTLLDFLRELLRLTLIENFTGEPFDQLKVWVVGLLDTRTSLGKDLGEGYFVDQIISQLDAVQTKLNSMIRTPALGSQYELVEFRVGALRSEQNRMVGMLTTIASAGLLKISQVVKLVKWLKKCDRPNGVAAGVLAAFYAATKPLDSLDDKDNRLEFGETWTIAPLKEAAKLQWSLFYLSALRNESSLLQTIGLDADGAERHIQDSVTGGVFQFLTGLVSNIRQERGLDEKNEEIPQDPLTSLASKSDPDNDDALYLNLEEMVHWLASKRHFLRNLKNKEEDVSLRRSQAVAPPANFQAFLSLVAVVYKSLPPDSAQQLWDESSFTSVILDGRSTFPPPAFWEMITAISNGPKCASKAYEKLQNTRLSWVSLFKFYQHYCDIMPHLFDPVKSRQTSLEPMPEDEYLVLLGWTKLLTAVVRGSSIARSALLQAKPHPLQLLFDFVNCDIPTDLKAAVLDTVTAFCEYRSDSSDEEVVIKAVEAYERISFADPTLEVRIGSRVLQPIGWIQRMEFAEQEAGLYPLTQAYISFLTALIPTSSSKSRLNNALRRGAMYIIDRVLLTQSVRRYARETERWIVLESILKFFERALIALDLTELQTTVVNRAIAGIATSLSDEAGFLVLLRLLSEPAVLAPLAAVVDHPTIHPSNSSLLRVLRIYYRILDIQLIFSDVLLVALSDSSRVPNQTQPFRRPLGFQSLDHYLLNHHLSNVTSIALNVGNDDLKISLVCIKIVHALAQSPLFAGTDSFRGEYSRAMNRLAGIIEASDESIRIAQGFCLRLEGEGEDLSLEELKDIERATLRGDAENDEVLPIVIRHAIVDLLVDGTADSTGPNIAHFLLGFDFRARELGLQDPRSPTSRLSCLRIILAHLDDADASSASTLVLVHPTLAAKCAQLIYQLFSSSSVGGPTMSYVESFAGFSARQLAILPRTCPFATAEPTGVATTYTEEVETTVEILTAYLDFQKWILSCVALETFASEGHGPSAEYVATALFQGSSEDEDFDEPQGQRPPLLIDLLSSVDIRYTELDSEATKNKVLEFYSGFPFDQFKRPDSDWYDLESLDKAAKSFRKQLEKTGAITGPSIDSMIAEQEYIIKRLSLKNHETEIAISKGGFLTAWNELLKVSITMLFQNGSRFIEEDKQDVFLFDLLDALLDRITNSESLAPGVLEILCEATLVGMATLVSVLSLNEAVRDSNLPVERLVATLIKIIDAVVRPGTTESARGNLYASISQYLHLSPATIAGSIDDTASIASTSITQTHANAGATTLPRATLRALGVRKDRFIAILCRDAMDVRDVWKTECFALLGAITALVNSSGNGGDGEKSVISPVAQGGFLNQFVKGIKDGEMALQECLGPEPESLHAFWVYESKLSFLTTFSATRRGAEELIDSGIFETLATCSFITAQPLTEAVFSDPASFEIVDRQHRTLGCALRLLVRCLSSLTKSTRGGTGHALSFLNAHKESLLLLLQETQQNVSLTSVQECALIIALLGMVVRKVPAEDQRSATGFGAFHLATVSLAAKFFERDVWTESIMGQDDMSELQNKVLELNQIILSYLCTTTAGLKNGEGSPVLVTGVARANGTARHLATAPSLPTTVNFLSELLEAVQDLSNNYEDMLVKIQDGQQLMEEEVESVPKTGMDIDLSVEGLREAFTIKSKMILNMIESLSLLIWRHLLFYANDSRNPIDAPVRPDTLSLSFSTPMEASRLSSAAGMGSSINRAQAASVRALEKTAAALRGVLSRADDLELSVDLISKPDAYHGMLVRRLKELCAGLSGVEMDES